MLLMLPACHRQDGTGVRVVLITLDTLRYDALAGSDDRSSDMPKILAWAKQSALLFERFYSATNSTAPSHASILTGLHPWQHGLTRNGLVLSEEFITLPERFREAGFSTAAVVASVATSKSSGFAQGFERFVEALPRRDGDRREYALAGEIADRALRELADARGMRQFFWFHFMDAHTPYGDAAGAERPLWTADAREQAVASGDAEAVFRQVRELYSADVHQLDTELARLIRRLEQDAQRLQTHIVITSDHGECLGEEARLGHGKHLNEPAIRVPTLIVSPGVSAGVRQQVAGSVDLHATILSLAEIEVEPELGRDLLKHAGEGALGMRRTFDAPIEDLRADGTIRTIDRDLFFRAEASGLIIRSDCEHLFGPPSTEIPKARRKALLVGFQSQCDELRRRHATAVDPQAASKLRALGYVQ